MRYYLARYVGTGAPDDPFRPSGAFESPTWSAVDLRPDPSKVDGLALLAVPDALATSPNRFALGDNPDEPSATMRRGIESRLGVTLADDRLRRIVLALLLEHGDDANPNRWNRLRPDLRRARAYQVWLGGLFAEVPVVAGAATASDNFNRADSTALGGSWTETVGDLQVLANLLRVVIAATPSVARWDADFAGSDLFCQVNVGGLNVGTGFKQIDPTVRHDAVTDTYYAMRYSWTNDFATATRSIFKKSAGVETALSTETAAIAMGDLIRVEVAGSTLTAKVNGAVIPGLTVTDVSIPVGRRCGIGIRSAGGTDRATADNWSAGDLGVTVVGTRATEADTATGGARRKTRVGGRATEADTATAGSARKTAVGARATEADVAQVGAARRAVVGGQAGDVADARAGSVRKTVAGGQAVEAADGRAGGVVRVVHGGQVVTIDAAIAGAVGRAVAGKRADEVDEARGRSVIFRRGEAVGAVVAWEAS